MKGKEKVLLWNKMDFPLVQILVVVANSKVKLFTTDEWRKVPKQLCLALGKAILIK